MTCKKAISLDTNKSNFNLSTQNIANTSTHTVPTQYRILSKNDFGVHRQRINLGVFNKKTDFRISPKKSIIMLKNDFSYSSNIEEILKEPLKYYIIHHYTFDNESRNNTFMELELNDKIYKIELTYELGKLISEYIKTDDETVISEFPEEYKIFIKNFLSEKTINSKKTYKFNKYILTNTNYKFLLGLLNIIQDSYIPNNINVYNISLILNLLETSYSIRKGDSLFCVRFKLSSYLKKLLISDNENKILNDYKKRFRNIKYIANFNKDIYLKKLTHEDYNENAIDKLTWKIELMPANDFYFEKIEAENDEQKMYDLIMKVPDNEAGTGLHNFFLDGLPLLSNSDGDIVGIFGLFTKEAGKEAEENFSTHNKTKFVQGSNMQIANFGVKTDSQLGLYNATKNIK